MTIPTLNQNMYFRNDNTNVVQNDKIENNGPEKVNNLKSIYIDPDALSKLTTAHTVEILTQKVKDIQESKPLKDANFEKESKSFDKSNVQSMTGDLKTAQANISSKRVIELLK